MGVRAFTDKADRPDDNSIAQVLDLSYAYYRQLLALPVGHKAVWQFSGSSGWMQKVFDSKKALFYVIPHLGSYMVSLTVREAEREDMLLDKRLTFAHAQLQNARKFSEGYHLLFEVKDESAHLQSMQFLSTLIYIRNQNSIQ